jgi:hypothetical protein
VKGILTIIGSLLVLQATTQNFWKGNISGEGPIITRTVNLANFDGVINGFSCDVEITRGSDHKVVLEGQENILNNLRLDVDDGILKIKYDRTIKRASKVKIYITMPTLTHASLSGSGDMRTTNHFGNLDDLEVGVSGSGNLSLSASAKSIEARLSGSGSVVLEGNTKDLEISISGSGDLDARQLESDNCVVRISGSGNATVYVHQALEARVSGSGNIRYQGDVAKVQSRVSGSGSVRSI